MTDILLTQKEKEIIRLKAQEKTVDEIASHLTVSKSYAEKMITILYDKCGVSNAVGLVNWGYCNGILKINADDRSNRLDKAG